MGLKYMLGSLCRLLFVRDWSQGRFQGKLSQERGGQTLCRKNSIASSCFQALEQVSKVCFLRVKTGPLPSRLTGMGKRVTWEGIDAASVQGLVSAHGCFVYMCISMCLYVFICS